MPHPLPPSCLAAAEATFGRRLPAGYAARLLRENGGTVACRGEHFELYPVRDETDRKRLARTAVDVVVETESASSWPRFPAGALAVGHNGTGDLLILRPDPDSPADSPRYAEAVLWWNHETGETTPVATSFENVGNG